MALSVVKEGRYSLALTELWGTSDSFWALIRALG